MKQNEYDLKIAKAIKAIRQSKGFKQLMVAENIKMKECNYNKIEMGRKPLLPSRLKVISIALGCSVNEIFKLADAED